MRRSFEVPPWLMLTMLKHVEKFNDGRIYVMMNREGIERFVDELDLGLDMSEARAYVFEKTTSDDGVETITFVEAING